MRVDQSTRRDRPRLRAAITVLGVMWSACIVSAQVVYTEQLRQVSIGLLEIKTAPDFGPWKGFTELFVVNPPPAPPGYGLASQNSRLDPNGIFASGRVEGIDNTTLGGGGGILGRSLLDIRFRLDAPSDAVLRIRATGGGGSFTTSSLFRLKHFGLLLHSFNGTREDHDFVFAPLPAGDYQLEYTVQDGMPGFGTGQSFTDYSMSFIVPEPGTAVLALLGICAARRRR